jgi:lipoate-protein ligase A
MTAPIRLLPFLITDGPRQMAADEVMLEAAVDGRAALRLYAWDPPTLSLGYFQRHAERLRDPQLAALPWVRRATGGGAIVHAGDLTYAVALPRSHRQGRPPADWHCRIHQALTRLLRERQVAAEVVSGGRAPPGELDFLCFAVPQPGDVVLAGRKIIGGAQRVRKGALLQHGSMQIPAGQVEPDAFARQLAEALGWRPEPADWSPAERERITELARTKYSQDAWNRKR